MRSVYIREFESFYIFTCVCCTKQSGVKDCQLSSNEIKWERTHADTPWLEIGCLTHNCIFMPINRLQFAILHIFGRWLNQFSIHTYAHRIFITTRQCTVQICSNCYFAIEIAMISPVNTISSRENCISSKCNTHTHTRWRWKCVTSLMLFHQLWHNAHTDAINFISCHHQISNKAIALQLQLHLLHAPCACHHQQCGFSPVNFQSSSIQHELCAWDMTTKKNSKCFF